MSRIIFPACPSDSPKSVFIPDRMLLLRIFTLLALTLIFPSLLLLTLISESVIKISPILLRTISPPFSKDVELISPLMFILPLESMVTLPPLFNEPVCIASLNIGEREALTLMLPCKLRLG